MALESSPWTKHSRSSPGFCRSLAMTAAPVRRSAASRPESRSSSFWRPDEPFQPATMPRADTADQEHVLEQDKPAIHRLAVHAERRCEARHVEQLACRYGRMVDQPAQLIALSDRCDVGNIPLGQRARIGAQPGTARDRAAGKPRETTRSIRSTVGPGSSRPGKSPTNARSRNPGGPAPAMRRASVVLPDWRGPTMRRCGCPSAPFGSALGMPRHECPGIARPVRHDVSSDSDSIFV